MNECTKPRCKAHLTHDLKYLS